MDPGVIALMIPIVAIVSGTAVKIAKMFAPQGPQGLHPDIVARVEGMEGEIADLRQQLGEAHERLDFAERLLAKPSDQKTAGG